MNHYVAVLQYVKVAIAYVQVFASFDSFKVPWPDTLETAIASVLDFSCLCPVC